MNRDGLKDASRLLVEARLRPVQGERFQSTGFPDLGPATYSLPDGTEMLLVESAQSTANRLEAVCWEEERNDLVPELRGMPYVQVVDEKGEVVTTSVLEAHRLNSPYILESADRTFFNRLAEALNAANERATDRRLLARTVFEIDPNAILHGVFLAKRELAGGRFRLARILSGFVEARGVKMVESGGVKNDRVNPSGSTKEGFGNVPFHRTEFVAEEIRAYFSLDLATLRSYGLPEAAESFLMTIGMWKILRFLSQPMRFRTACDLECFDWRVTRPEGYRIPEMTEISKALASSMKECADLFAKPPVSKVVWKPGKAKKEKDRGKEENDEGDES
ncbi:MAG: type I-U CRISPR-associated RAMP protein Csb1/Cas7u [Candidatus Eisenbacteria bacterium]